MIGVLVIGAGPVLAQNGVDLQGLFQLEYNANANASAVQAQNGAPNPGYTGDDWSTVNAGAAGTTCPNGTNCTVRTGVLADLEGSAGQNDDIFTGGGSKDISDISSWKWKYAGNSAVDKDDITNAYAAAYSPTTGSRAGHLILYFGADRFANSGNALLGFWFLHQGIIEAGAGKGGGSPFTLGDGTTVATHQAATLTVPGDVVVFANLTSGGAVARMQVLMWDPNHVWATGTHLSGTPFTLLLDDASDFAAHCADGNLTAPACMTTNSSSTPLYWSYSTKGGATCTVNGTTVTTCSAPAVTFFEGGIDIDAVVGAGNNCFSSFLAETRSSSGSVSNIDYNATLKDLKLGSFPVCGLSGTKTCTDAVLDPTDGQTFHYSFDGTVTVTGGVAYHVVVTDKFPDNTDASSKRLDTANPPTATGDTLTIGTLDPTGNAGPASVTYHGKFDLKANGDGIANQVSITGCAVDQTPCIGLNQLQTTASWDIVHDSNGGCRPPTRAGLALHKQCSVNFNTSQMQVTSVNVSGSVCNTGEDAWTDIIVKDTPSGGVANPSNVIVFGSSDVLQPNTCSTFSSSYSPSQCNGTSGVCSFTDVISVTKGNALYKGNFDCTSGTCSGSDTSLKTGIADVQATCYLCTTGSCQTNTVDPNP